VPAVAYWLVNSGTVQDPYRPPRDHIAQRFLEWEAEWGDVQFFDRAYKMRHGDVLIHRAVGSDAGRLSAVGVVLASPKPSRHSRWPFAVRRRLAHRAASLQHAPRLEDIDERPVRVTKRLSESAGRLAERLIAQAADGD
jgi:hypothetical protein